MIYYPPPTTDEEQKHFNSWRKGFGFWMLLFYLILILSALLSI